MRQLTFLGGVGTVTGSKYLIQAESRRILLECGLFQGLEPLRLRNWEAPPFDPRRIDAVVVSHAHLDHTGYLPVIARAGFRGPIFSTRATDALLPILLRDAAHIQEEDAERANSHGYSKHNPALPLFTAADAEAALALRRPMPYDEPFEVASGVTALLRRAGHILGSATVELRFDGDPGARLAFSGDLGPWGRPMLRDPELVPEADIVLIESTYGDRTHAADPSQALATIVNEIVANRGVLIVPSFAVGRTQEIVWTLRMLEDAGRIPAIPVFVDSPMAIDVTELFCRFPEDHRLDMTQLMDEQRCPLCCRQYRLVRTASESKALNDRAGPMIIVSASGMATAGRVLHHLARRLPDPSTRVLLPGFQAAGTRGRALQEGATSVKIHGRTVPVRARVHCLDGFSAHADRDDLLRWAKGFRRPPKRAFVVHGEPRASEALASALAAELGWRAPVARDGETVSLAA